MSTPTRTRWASPWLGALLALLGCGLVAPGQAKAGCRHPGLSAWGSSAMLGALDVLMVGDAAPALRQAPVEAPAPCEGPSCSGQNAPPLAPSSTKPHDPGQRWALGAFSAPVADSRSEATPRDDARLRPTHISLAIFHPPRLAVFPPTS